MAEQETVLRLCLNCKYISGGSESANCKKAGPAISLVTGNQRWRVADSCTYQRGSGEIEDCGPLGRYWEIASDF